MALKKLRVILDTNWYVSATINKNSRRVLYELLTNKSLIILFNDEILKEYKQVIARDKFKKIVKAEQVTRFMKLVMSKLEIIEVKTKLSGNRDTNDNFLLSLSFDGKSDYLITGDMDLLILQTTGSTKIVTLRDFLEIIAHKTI
jgi:hypothetical protein